MVAAQKQSKKSTFISRLGSTLVLWAVIVAIFASDHPVPFILLLSAVGALALKEYFGMLRAGGVPHDALWGYLVGGSWIMIPAVNLLFNGSDAIEFLHRADLIILAGAMIGIIVIQFFQPVEGKETIIKMAVTIFGVIYVSYLFSLAPRLLFLPEIEGLRVPGAWLLLWLLAVTKFTDMGAYITGSLIGKHKMVPHISPAKTWQGFFGALVFAELIGLGLFFLMPERLFILGNAWTVAILTAGLSLLAVVGDLAASILKRSLNVKDSGQILPGIGGAIDLIDSVLFTAPVLYFYLTYFAK